MFKSSPPLPQIVSPSLTEALCVSQKPPQLQSLQSLETYLNLTPLPLTTGLPEQFLRRGRRCANDPSKCRPPSNKNTPPALPPSQAT